MEKYTPRSQLSACQPSSRVSFIARFVFAHEILSGNVLFDAYPTSSAALYPELVELTVLKSVLQLTC